MAMVLLAATPLALPSSIAFATDSRPAPPPETLAHPLLD
jgi:hypothetical protein